MLRTTSSCLVAVLLVGAAILIPLSPGLIFGFGPLPALGIAGAGTAVTLFFQPQSTSGA